MLVLSLIILVIIIIFIIINTLALPAAVVRPIKLLFLSYHSDHRLPTIANSKVA